MVKHLLLSLIFLCCLHTNHAQFYKSILPSKDFTDSLSKIVVDFKNNFHELEGDQIQSYGETEVFLSKVCLPAAQHCTVTHYHSKEDPSSSWQAIMYEGESYKEALNCYKNTFRLVKKSLIKGIERSNGYFKGTLETPPDNVPFAVSSLKLYSSENLYLDFYAEVEIVNNYTGWEVHLNLHDKKPDEIK